MAIQLTPEQEERIQAIVNAGAYSSAEAALDAALAAVETAVQGFEGRPEELENLLREGLDSGEAVEADHAYWNRLRAETDTMAREHRARNPIG